jgi:hypothetical protein
LLTASIAFSCAIHANDLGAAAFDREPLVLTRCGLVLNRYDSEIRFMRVRP